MLKSIKFYLIIATVAICGMGSNLYGMNNIYDFTIAQEMGEDYQVISDEVKGGIRYITATPSQKVCSVNIDIEIDVKSNTIQKVVYTRGCDGNAKGIGALIKGMKVDEAIKRLEGITCGRRPTSCPDQLAKILKSLK